MLIVDWFGSCVAVFSGRRRVRGGGGGGGSPCRPPGCRGRFLGRRRDAQIPAAAAAGASCSEPMPDHPNAGPIGPPQRSRLLRPQPQLHRGAIDRAQKRHGAHPAPAAYAALRFFPPRRILGAPH